MSRESTPIASSQQYGYTSDKSGYQLEQQPVAEAVITLLQKIDNSLPSGSLCVDIGCGPGRMSREVPRNNFDFIGIDADSIAIKTYNSDAQSRSGRDRAIVGNMLQLKQALTMHHVDKNHISVALLHRVPHLLEPTHQADLLKQTRRILPPKSPIIITTAADTDWKAQTLRIRGTYSPDHLNDCAPVMGRSDPFLVHFANEAHIQSLAKQAHLKTISVQTVTERSGYQLQDNSYLVVQFQTPGVLFHTADKLVTSLQSVARRTRRCRK